MQKQSTYQQIQPEDRITIAIEHSTVLAPEGYLLALASGINPIVFVRT